MRATLEEFKRLCDETVILCCNAGPAEKALIYEYGFRMVQDNREWGRLQWKIKQDFIEGEIAKRAHKGDMLVCLDMDEVLSKTCTKEWILAAPLDAYHVFIVDVWNDEQHYKPASCFWNVRLWRWNGETKWKEKPVHCGLAPQWAYHYHRHAPFILKHFGLMKKEDRQRKVVRYEQYDPNAEHLDKRYYDMLKSDSALPFDEAKILQTIEKEVASYKQTKPRQTMLNKPKPRFAYIRNQHGVLLDIPERDLKETLMRKGFSFVGWVETNEEELKDLFDGEDVGNAPALAKEPIKQGSYQKDAHGFGPGNEWKPADEKVLDDKVLDEMVAPEEKPKKKTIKKK